MFFIERKQYRVVASKWIICHFIA